MAHLFLRKRRPRRCYFCQDAPARDATYREICLWHQFRISFRLLLLLVRARRLRSLWRIVRWW
jgi:hypothetical protein